MTATHAPGLPCVEDGLLVSTNPATGAEVARVPEIADLLGRECGKPVVDGVTETAAFLPTSPGRPATPAGSWACAGYAGPCSSWSSPRGWSTSRSA